MTDRSDSDPRPVVAPRGRGQGEYSSPIRDKVSLDSATPQLRSDAPRLDDASLADKLSITGEVLGHMAVALSAHSPDGLAQLQLVIDTTPPHLRSLMHGVSLDSEGQLDEARLVHNLRSRLPSEQPLLLMGGLIDLLDRALERCLSVLSEPAADALLAEVLGYQKRLRQ